MNSKEINKEKPQEVISKKKVKYQCLHTEEEKECTCIRSKGLVLMK